MNLYYVHQLLVATDQQRHGFLRVRGRHADHAVRLMVSAGLVDATFSNGNKESFTIIKRVTDLGQAFLRAFNGYQFEPIPHRAPLLDYSYQSTAKAVEPASTLAQRGISEMRTFRTISRQFFGAQARQEYVKEAIFFVSISCVAAWSVTVMIQQLISMMIGVPLGGLW